MQPIHKPFSMATILLACTLFLGGCATSVVQHNGEALNSQFTRYPVDREIDPAIAARSDAIYKLMVAELAGQRGDNATASKMYTEVALAHPNAELLSRATLINMFAGEHEHAVVTARAWFELSEDEADAIAALTGSLLKADRLDEALTALDDWLESTNTQRAQVFAQIGQFLSHHIAPASALLFGQEVARRYPDDLDAQIMQARLAIVLNAHELALPPAHRAVELSPLMRDAHQLRIIALSETGPIEELVTALEQALTIFPDDSRFRSALLQVYAQTGQTAKAQLQLIESLSRNPNDVQMLRTAALLALQADDIDQARHYLARLARQPGQENEATLLLGRIEMEQGHFETARSLFEHITSADAWLEAQIRIAESYQLEGRIDDAISFLSEKFSQVADIGDAQRLKLMQGVLLIREGDYERAFDIYSEALAIWPDSPEFRLQRALTAERLGWIDRLEADLRIILERDPNNAEALNALGYTLADRTDRYEEALELIERAVALDGNNAAYLDSLGWVYYKLGRYEEALEQLDRAYRMSSGYAEIGAHLGEVLWTLNQRERAREIWLESLEADPDHAVLRETLRRLAPELLP